MGDIGQEGVVAAEFVQGMQGVVALEEVDAEGIGAWRQDLGAVRHFGGVFFAQQNAAVKAEEKSFIDADVFAVKVGA